MNDYPNAPVRERTELSSVHSGAHTLRRAWPPASVLTALLILAGCSSNPIGPVTDFDFVFREIQEVGLGSDPDTSAIPIDYQPAAEDTSYLEVQDGFLSDAGSAPQTGSVPPTVVSVSEAVFAAFNASTSDQLNTFAGLADADADAFVADTYSALLDSTSETFVLAESISQVAAEEAALDNLLGLSASESSARISLRGIPASNATPVGAQTFAVRGAMSCEDDARIQAQTQMQELEEDRARRENLLERSRQNSIAAAEAFRTRELSRIEANVVRRRQEAARYYANAVGAIGSLVQNGLINQGTASNLRRAMVTVILFRLKHTIEYAVRSRAAVHRKADETIDAAQSRYELQSAQLATNYSVAMRDLGTLESSAVQDCHDQGSSNG